MWTLEKALFADDPEDALEVLEVAESAVLARFESAYVPALRGGFDAVQVLVASWDALLDDAFRSASLALAAVEWEPGHDGTLWIQGRVAKWLPTLIRTAVGDAPFSRFVAAYGVGGGMALTCVAEVRNHLPGLAPLVPPGTDLPEVPRDVDVLRFHRLVDLAVRGLAPPLERVQDALGLTTGELGGLFGVSRQAIEQWKVRGVPEDRRPKLADLVAVVDLLDRKLKPGRLPLVARRPASAFGGRSILEMVAADHHRDLRGSVEGALDWAATA